MKHPNSCRKNDNSIILGNYCVFLSHRDCRVRGKGMESRDTGNRIWCAEWDYILMAVRGEK